MNCVVPMAPWTVPKRTQPWVGVVTVSAAWSITSDPCLNTLTISPKWKRPTSVNCCLSSSVVAALKKKKSTTKNQINQNSYRNPKQMKNLLENDLLSRIQWAVYLSFWQTKRLNEFSAPRKVSSSKISTAAIQFGLLSRAICKKS